MPSPTFELFEDICNELNVAGEAILPNEFLSDDRLRDLQDECGGVAPDAAFENALAALAKHFKARDSSLPFTYDLSTRSFKVTDKTYVDFVAQASNIRGLGKRSRAFEEATCRRLTLRGSGTFHRVGWPRGHKKKRKEFIAYLRTLGFGSDIIYGKEKDGGLDILWLLPLGAIPRRPIVSLQCKNGSFNLANADSSNGPARRSLGRHRGLLESVHTLCVIFNDYIEKTTLGPKAFDFVALGLSDLASPKNYSQFTFL